MVSIYNLSIATVVQSALVKCFENGRFRYVNPNGAPMQIEVPSDKYDDAVKAMKERIRRGQIPGV